MSKHLEVILYEEDGWSFSKIEKILQDHKSVKKYAIGLHDRDTKDDGTPDKVHFHAYANFGRTNVSIAHFAAWFEVPQEKVARIKKGATMYNVVEYYLHIDEPNKVRYGFENVKANFDVEEFIRKSEAVLSIDDVIDRISDGTITRQNFNMFIDVHLYSRYKREIENAFEYVDKIRELLADGERECTSYWIYGNSRLGKSTIAKLFAKKQGMSVYTSAEGTDPFQEYSDQDCIILNDVRPENMPFIKLINAIDPYVESKVGSRYRNKRLVCRMLLITSTLSAPQYAKAFPEEESRQLYARLEEQWHVDENEITAYKYDQKYGCFRKIWTVANPLPQYLKTRQHKEKTNAEAVLNKIKVDLELMTDGIQEELSDTDSKDIS